MNYEEMIELLKTAKKDEEIDNYRLEIAEIIPQVKIMFDYDQKNHTHQYDLWHHSLHAVLELPRGLDDDMLYLGALLHDIGNPDCQTAGHRIDDENMHYYGHPEKGAQIVQDEVLSTLHEHGIDLLFEDQKRLVYYVKYHDDHVSLRMKHLRRHLQMTSLENFKKLMLLQVADAKAHVRFPFIEERIEICGKLAGVYADELYERMIIEDSKRH